MSPAAVNAHEYKRFQSSWQRNVTADGHGLWINYARHMRHNVYTFFSVYNCLDEDFDAPDAGADHALCRAIAAGKRGMHPDSWDIRSSLTAVMPQGFRGYEWVPEQYRRPFMSVEDIAERKREHAAWEAKHRRRPVEEPPKPRAWHPHTLEWQPTIGWKEPLAHGEVQLTCDVCYRARFHITLEYHGDRPSKVAAIRLMGRTAGWTCIAGTDRCPECSTLHGPNEGGDRDHEGEQGDGGGKVDVHSPTSAPEAVGNGTGKDQGHKQHANGGG